MGTGVSVGGTAITCSEVGGVLASHQSQIKDLETSLKQCLTQSALYNPTTEDGTVLTKTNFKQWLAGPGLAGGRNDLKCPSSTGASPDSVQAIQLTEVTGASVSTMEMAMSSDASNSGPLAGMTCDRPFTLNVRSRV